MARIKGKLTTADYLPIEEFSYLIDCLHNDKEYIWELYCRLSFCTALRASDVLSLTWETILHKEYFDITEQKTKKSRRITFVKSKPDATYEELLSIFQNEDIPTSLNAMLYLKTLLNEKSEGIQ